ncbi:hypothetical protein OROHE_010567 [Orobanche hederae]
MQTLQEKASEWSGVATNDAFAIDETNLYEKLGLQTFINLSTNFYNRVYDDEEEWFRSIFANSKKEEAIQNQYEFFTQRMRGPPLFSQRRENFEVGDEISRELIQLKPNDAGCYVLLSNMYALAGNWDSARMSRVSLKSNNLKKNPGFSSVEINGEMFTFMATQKDHPHYLEIKKFLEGLMLKIKSAGYEPDTNSVVLNVSNDVTEDILFHHSEKLAVAFGLMRTKPGTVVRITKNLRICDDCHLASKFASKVYDRVLIIKDANRFHVFRDGICSCNDWW